MNPKETEDTVEKGTMDKKEKEETAKEDGEEAKKDDSDVVFVQDVGFTVKIIAPGLEPFDIQVSSMELVQEIHQLLMDREETCHRTCFSLQLNGNTLDNFAELKTVECLSDGSELKVVEEPYTVREARIHVRHVRDLLKSVDSSDAYGGLDGASLAFLNNVCHGDIMEKRRGGSAAAAAANAANAANAATSNGNKGAAAAAAAAASSNSQGDSIDCTPPDYILPSSTERPLLPLHMANLPVSARDQNKLACLKVLTTSGWNPPPGSRRMHGDLMYVFIITLEDKRVHVTASSRGFYVNQTTEEEFNPKPAAAGAHLSHSLVDLLAQISPGFKKNFAQLQKRRTQRHPYERVATPYQIYTWLSPINEHTIDAIRAEDAFSSKLGYEEHIPGQTRDWNEELQTTRELPRKNLPERLLRERAVFKVHSDFVSAATRGAIAVIDGNVMAINPGEDAKMQMFIWNNIFFSLGFDVRDHYKALGGDAAAFVAPRNDLQGVKVYNAVDLEGLYTLGTVVVDYRGYRVTAQSIIPGILEREQEQSVVYGSIDFGKTVVTHSKYMDLLQKAGSQLKILPHTVINDKEEEIGLCSSVECKGIIGNDGRHYILDLLRTFPPDVNFLQLDDIELSKEAHALGFPIVHKHKLCCLRQELIDAFVESRYMMFIKYAAVQLQQLGHRKQMDLFGTPKDQAITHEEVEKPAEGGAIATKGVEATEAKDSDSKSDNKTVDDKDKLEAEEAKKIVESITDSITSGEKKDIEESTRDIVKKAAQAVGSLKETEFDIRFNPDVYSPGVKHKEQEGDFFKKQCQLVRDASDFLLTVQIPAFIRDCLDHSAAPMDGQTLSDNLHNRGINIRYIGVIANMLSKVPQLGYIHSIAVSEVLVRSSKHLFTTYMQGLEMTHLGVAIAHFLNCFLSSCPTVTPVLSDELIKNNGGSKKRNNKRNGQQRSKQPSGGGPINNVQEGSDWTSLTPRGLWKQIKEEAESYFNFDLNAEAIDSVCEAFGLQKVSLLRAFGQATGVQLQLREYSGLDNSNSKNAATHPVFSEDDVINVFPVVKHINPRATDAYNFYTTGQSKIQQGFLKDGYELISESLHLLNNVYGAMHPEIAQCLRMLARLNYIMGEHGEAMAFQQKAVLMSERVNGVDHPYTITEYTHLALYCFANSQISTALKLLYRSRYLALIVAGENHPEVALIDSNIGLILHAVAEYDLSLKFLEKALQLNLKYHGDKSLKVAVSYHLVARTQSCMGDFRSALQNEKETYAIYRSQLGDEHDKTKESSECLKHLTAQAVVLQKKMNEIYTGRSKAVTLPPIQISPPSMGSVLDMLNIINGILFVQISQRDIENFKVEFEKRQQKDEQQQQPAIVKSENSQEQLTSTTTNAAAAT